MKTWRQKLTWEQQQRVHAELREFGLDSSQIESLMKHKGRVKEIELLLMRDLPDNTWGKRPTINVVKSAIRDCQTLGLLTVNKKPSVKTRGQRKC
jgi:hypothetical protein